ncbi:hypothetical protein SAMN05216201_11157 [Pseudomonas linyingensis]|uniref:Uncharacterized protein n=1 Tax=Pseudomonas linyingensis TaxID=915471 RepID=A0A1H7A6G2_9PSED|nr:hypothetical protein [Pseudomonas linyingensis]SEJ57602.1 hypothetical protein SAMN05216201_11157 [Pseudomonas linyingensis]
MIYSSTLSAVVSALAAECIDNTSKQKWQQLYQSGELRPCGQTVSPEDRMTADCWVFARLHHGLKPRHWHALVAKFSTHKGRKVEAIGKLVPLVATPAGPLFLYKAVTTWAIPALKGADGKRSTKDLLILPAPFYDMNTWESEGRPEQTRRRWRLGIHKVLNEMVGEALVEAETILCSEGVLVGEAA